MAMFCLTGCLVARERRAEMMVQPAEGPSLGVAPWEKTERRLNNRVNERSCVGQHGEYKEWICTDLRNVKMKMCNVKKVVFQVSAKQIVLHAGGERERENALHSRREQWGKKQVTLVFYSSKPWQMCMRCGRIPSSRLPVAQW